MAEQHLTKSELAIMEVMRRTCYVLPLLWRNRNWNFDGINFQKGFICRKANAVCHGTSELPFSFFKKRFTFNVGKGKGLLRKSIYDYLSCINDYLVSTDI